MTRTNALASLDELDALTQSILDHGIDADCSALVALARAARSAGLSETLIGVTLDPAEPLAARQRAFASLARGLSRAPHQWSTTTPHHPAVAGTRAATTPTDGVRSTVAG